MFCPVVRAIFVFSALSLTAACGQGVYRVDSSDYGYAARHDLTVDDVRPLVERVATNKGWELSDVKRGSFVGKRQWGGGKHNIVVTVTYRPKSFNIDYKDSKRMGYNGSSIHHAYVDMVKELEAAIKDAVSGL